MKLILASKCNYGSVAWYAVEEPMSKAHKKLTGRSTFTDSDCEGYEMLGFQVVKTPLHYQPKASRPVTNL